MNIGQKNISISLVALLVTFAQFATVAQNDRAIFGLNRNVTKVIYEQVPQSGMNYESYELFGDSDLEFSNTGKLIKIGGQEVKTESFEGEVYYSIVYYDNGIPTVERGFHKDAQGRITTTFIESGCGDGFDTIVYDNKGRIVQKISKAYVESGYNELGKWEEGKYIVISDVKYFYDENNNLIKVVVCSPTDKKTHTITYQYKLFDRAGNWLIRVANCASMQIKNYIEKRKIEY